MKDEEIHELKPERDTERTNMIWQYGKSTALLERSEADLSEQRKEMIRFALDYNIRDIRTYRGYKGDLLIGITTTDRNVLPVLKARAEELGMETVIKERSDIRIHEIYCIVRDEGIYRLKEPS